MATEHSELIEGIVPRLREVVPVQVDLVDYIEAQPEGWLGDVKGWQVSLRKAEDKLAHTNASTPHSTTTDLGLPTISHVIDIPDSSGLISALTSAGPSQMWQRQEEA